MQGVGGLLLVRRALADVLDGQGRHDDHDLPDTAQLAGLQEHASQARVDGQACQAAPDLRQARPPAAPVGSIAGPGGGGPGRLDGADLREQLQAGADLAGVGGVQEGEVLHRPQSQGRHLQDDAGQRGAQDLRLGVLRARLEVSLRVQADGDAVGHAPAAARPLVGAGPADRLDRQALDLGAVGVAGDARQARVDDVADPGNRQGGLGHVRGQDDAAHLVGLEDPVLLGGAQARVQGHDLDGPRCARAAVGRVARSQVVDEGRLGVADIALTGQEDKDVTTGLAQQLVDGVEDPGHLVLGLAGSCTRPGRAGPAPTLAASALVAQAERGGAGIGADGLPAGPRRGAHRRIGGGQCLQLGLAQLAGRCRGGSDLG